MRRLELDEKTEIGLLTLCEIALTYAGPHIAFVISELLRNIQDESPC